MKVDILIRDPPINFEDFMREHNMKPFKPDNPLASIPYWTNGPGGLTLVKEKFEGKLCYRATGGNGKALIKFIRTLWAWSQ